RSSSSLSLPSATSATVSRPAGAAAGDVLLALVGVRGSGNLTPPAGWTLLRTDSRASLYDHVAGASEPSGYTWTLSAPSSVMAAILDYSGAEPAAPVGADDGQVT